jgi:hypothetical protein
MQRLSQRLGRNGQFGAVYAAWISVLDFTWAEYAITVEDVYILWLQHTRRTKTVTLSNRVSAQSFSSNINPLLFSNLHIMVILHLRHAIFISALITSTAAQDETIVPDDLQSGFRPGGDEVQVSFTGDAVNGFKDGTVFEKDG